MGQGSGTSSASQGGGQVRLAGIRKSPGGKLLRCSIQMSGPRIASVRITGDFFMHPEDKLDELEAMLAGLPLEEKPLVEAVARFYASGVEVVGAGVEDFVELMMAARAQYN